MKTSATAQIFRLQTLFRALVGPNVAVRSISMTTQKKIQDAITGNNVVMFSKSYCPYCKKAKDALKGIDCKFTAIELDITNDYGITDMAEAQGILKKMTGASSVPRVFVGGEFVGGGDETAAEVKNGKLKARLDKIEK